jgi:hypothetical protein
MNFDKNLPDIVNSRKGRTKSDSRRLSEVSIISVTINGAEDQDE